MMWRQGRTFKHSGRAFAPIRITCVCAGMIILSQSTGFSAGVQETQRALELNGEQVIGSLKWEIVETGTGKLLGDGQRKFQLKDVVVSVGKQTTKAIPLGNHFILSMAESPDRTRTDKKGFGLRIARDDLESVFSWEWFTVDREGHASKLQESGDLEIKIAQVGSNWEVTRTAFSSDVSLRAFILGKDALEKPRWRVKIFRDSIIYWPSIVDGKVVATGRIESPKQLKEPQVAGPHELTDQDSEDQVAKATFQRIEQSIWKTDIVSIQFTCDRRAGTQENRLRSSGTLLLKRPNKVRLNLESGMEFVSDGTRYSFRKAKPKSTPLKLGITLESLIARVGISILALFPVEAVSQAAENGDVSSMLKVSDLKQRKDENGAPTLLFTIQYGPLEHSGETILWYDASTFFILKRQVTFRDNNRILGTMTEVYEEAKLKSEIPDDNFALPEGEK